MHPVTVSMSSLSWNVSAVELDSDGQIDLACIQCESDLEIHQPDESQPHRLLGTCPRCGTWHIIELEHDGAKAVTFNIPDVALVRALLAHADGTAEALGVDPPAPPDDEPGMSLEGQVA